MSGGGLFMAEEWWTLVQAYHYLIANYPCEDGVAARHIIERMIEEGSLAARYRRPDGTTLAIERQEWRREPHSLEWAGWQREADRELQAEGGRAGHIEVGAAPLRRLCTPQRDAEGRTPREIVSRLLVLAGMWIEEYGVPKAGSGEQAALERFLTGQAGGQINAPSRIREIAVQAIGIARAYRKAGM
jgi:hypothetical protein